MKSNELIAYIDIDDTLVRSFGAKRMPITSMVEHVRYLHSQGVTIFLWSTAGADYVRSCVDELGLQGLIAGCLPKPHIMIDDQEPRSWRALIVVHPNQAAGKTTKDYLDTLYPDFA